MKTLREESLQFIRACKDLGALRKRHLSQHFDVSDKELCDLMNAEGFKYHDVLDQARMEILEQLVKSKPEVKTREVYTPLGFGSQEPFYRFFVKMTGATWYQARKAGWPDPGWKENAERSGTQSRHGPIAGGSGATPAYS